MRNSAAHEDFLTWRSSRNQKSAMELMLSLWRKTEEALGRTFSDSYSFCFSCLLIMMRSLRNMHMFGRVVLLQLRSFCFSICEICL